MRDFLRFFLSAADQARVAPASIAIADVPRPYVRDAYLYAYQSLQVTFRITDPANGAPQLRPMFPGSVEYLAEPGTPGVIPDPATINLTATDYATWRTLGTVKMKLIHKDAIAVLAEHGPGLVVKPNVAWYSPVQLSEQFLLTTLVSSLAKAKVGSGGGAVKPSDAGWSKHAVARFLDGRYTPELRLAANAADDDVAKHAMPTLVMDASGNVVLFITIARTQPPQDGTVADMDALAPGVTHADPEHPINGLIPARDVYRTLRPHLIDGAAGNALADAMMAAWPNARRYFPLHVTRTWKLVDNFSIQFPPRAINVALSAPVSTEYPIPAHGVVFVPQAEATPEPPLPLMEVVGISGPTCSWMDGRTVDAWKVRADSPATIQIAFATMNPDDPPPHIILRRPLNDEILADKVFPAPGGMRCTYMSLRRATRAFVDHRMTGGRLVNESATSALTKQLMSDAWGAASANILTNRKPLPTASPGAARTLEPIWQLFFSDDVPAHDVDGDGNLARTTIFDGGVMFYALWQTIESVLRAPGTKRNFSNEDSGKGAPGAIVAVGLSDGYLVDPPHNDPDPAVLDTNVDEMLDGRLVPGSVIQFWDLRTDYALIRTRSATAVSSYGHSPIFREYRPNGAGGIPDGIIVIDQFGGTSQVPLTAGGRLNWSGGANGEEIWIAAQWNE